MLRSILAAALLVGVALLSGAGLAQPPDGPPMPPEPGTVVPPHVRMGLNLTGDQEKQLTALEKDVKGRLKKVLSERQLKAFEDAMKKGPPGGGGKEMPKGPPGGGGKEMPKGPPGGPPGPGMGPPSLLIPPFVRDSLNMTPQQQQSIAMLDRYAATGLMRILTNSQRKQLEELMKQGPPARPDGPKGGGKD